MMFFLGSAEWNPTVSLMSFFNLPLTKQLWNRKRGRFWNAHSHRGSVSEHRSYSFVPDVFTLALSPHTNTQQCLSISGQHLVYSVLVCSCQISPNWKQICATVVSQECLYLARLRGTSVMGAQLHSLEVWTSGTILCYDAWSLMFHVHADDWVANESMRSVVLGKIFVSSKGLNWNWVLFA